MSSRIINPDASWWGTAAVRLDTLVIGGGLSLSSTVLSMYGLYSLGLPLAVTGAILVAVGLVADNTTRWQVSSLLLWRTTRLVRGDTAGAPNARLSARSRVYSATQLLTEVNTVTADSAAVPADRTAAQHAGWATVTAAYDQLRSAALALSEEPLDWAALRAVYADTVAGTVDIDAADRRLVDELRADGLTPEEVAAMVASSMDLTADQVATYLRVTDRFRDRLAGRPIFADHP